MVKLKFHLNARNWGKKLVVMNICCNLLNMDMEESVTNDETTLLSMPPDILHVIFTSMIDRCYIPTWQDDWRALRRSCSTLRYAINHLVTRVSMRPETLKNVEFYPKGSILKHLDMAHFSAIHNVLQALESLTNWQTKFNVEIFSIDFLCRGPYIWCRGPLKDDSMLPTALARHFPNLHTLCIMGDVLNSVDFFASLEKNIPALQSLTLMTVVLPKRAICHVAALTRLKSINLSCKLDQEDAQMILNMPLLKKLEVMGIELTAPLDLRRCVVDIVYVKTFLSFRTVSYLQGLANKIHVISLLPVWDLGIANGPATVQEVARDVVRSTSMPLPTATTPVALWRSMLWQSPEFTAELGMEIKLSWKERVTLDASSIIYALAPWSSLIRTLTLVNWRVDSAEVHAICGNLARCDTIIFEQCTISSTAWLHLHSVPRQCLYQLRIFRSEFMIHDLLEFASTFKGAMDVYIFNHMHNIKTAIELLLPEMMAQRAQIGLPAFNVVIEEDPFGPF